MIKSIKQSVTIYLFLIIALIGTAVSAKAVVIETGNYQALTQTTNSFSPQAGPAPFSIELMPQKQKIMTGEKLNVGVDLKWQEGVKVLFPIFPQPWGDWVIVSHQAGTPKKNLFTGFWEQKDKLVVMTFLDGKVDLPVLSAKFQVPNQAPAEYRSAMLALEVDPKVNKKGELEANLRDIKKPVWMISIWQIILALAVAAALLGAIVWYSRKSGVLNLGQKSEPMRPPEEVAREKLEALKNSNFLQNGKFKDYYIDLTNILRHYLEGRYFISALDRTTSELMKALKNILDRKDVLSLRDLLERSDVIKFAKGSPDLKEIDQDWNLVKDFVDKTTQIYWEKSGIEQKQDDLKSDRNQKSNTDGNTFTPQGRPS